MGAAAGKRGEAPRTGARLWCDGRVLRRPLALALSAVAAASGALVATPAEEAPARVVLTLKTASAQALQSSALRPPQDAAERTERASAVTPTRRR